MRNILAIILTSAFFLVICAGLAPPGVTAASEFTFKNTMSEAVLLKYCSRAVTFEGLCGEGGDQNLLIEEDIRMLLRTGTKFVSRAALFAWNSTAASQVESHFQYAEKMAAKVHAADSEIILQAFVAEIVRKSYVEKIAIPKWVFEAFGHTPETRNFRYNDIINAEKGPNYWGTDAGYPDYSNQETLYWYYYCIRRYIDIGFECIHIQENDEKDASEIPNVDKLLKMCREYAKTKARRGLVLFHSFFSMVTGGTKVGSRLLFDIQGNGLVPNETKKEVINGETVMKCEISSYEKCWLSWFGRSNGGEHPLGFTIATCPTILEFDNYGSNPNGKLGVATPSAFYNWGYDDITWFAIQPEWYRNEFLLYIDNFMKNNKLIDGNKQIYFPVMPMRRVITADPNWPKTTYKPGNSSSVDFLFDYAASVDKIKMEYNASLNTYTLITCGFYRANRQSDGCPNGFNQEDTIRRIFLGNAAENSKYNTVGLPAGYTPDKSGDSTSSSKKSPSAQAGSSAAPGSSAASRASGRQDESDADDNGVGTVLETESTASASSDDKAASSKSGAAKKKNNIGFPVIFGIAGAVILLCGGGCGAYFWIRRRKGSEHIPD